MLRLTSFLFTILPLISFAEETSTALLFEIPSSQLHCCNLTDEEFEPQILAFEPRAQDTVHLEEILSHTGLNPNFIFARSPSIGYNAVATMIDNQRVILYSEKLLDDLATDTKSNWSPASILAHEIGHHLQGHTLTEGGSTPKTELEADRFSGYVLARMGASMNEATATIKKLSSEHGSHTHPPRYARVAAITDGWKRAQTHLKAQLKALALDPEQSHYLHIAYRSEETSPGTWEWTAWIDADAASMAKIDSVTWQLHELLPEPERPSTNKASKFEISENSKGEFTLKAILKNDKEEFETLRKKLQFR